MKKEVNPIDLNYTEFERIYNDCLPKEGSKNFLRVILQQKSDGFPNDSKPIFFDKDKINEHKADIFYLYGQLASIHREQSFFFVINSIQKYDGTIWTDNQTSALLLLHLGMLCRDFDACIGIYPNGAEKLWESREMVRKRVLAVLEKYAEYEKVIVMGHAIMIQTITGEKRPFEYGEVVVWKNGENEAFL